MEVWKQFGAYYWEPFKSNVANTSISVTWSLLFAMLLFVAYWYLSIPSGIPPGPKGLPIVGYLPFLGERPNLTFTKLGKKYGSVFSFYLGSRLVVVLNDYKAIQKAFITHADIFAGRPKGFNLNFFRFPKDTKSISMTDGSYWKEHRRFITNHLNDCGMGKSTLEPQLTEEFQRFVAVMKSHNGRPTNFSYIIGLSVFNNIAMMTLGKHFEYDDPWIRSVKMINNQLLEKSAVNFMMGFPWLSYVPMLDRFTSRSLRKVLKKIQDIIPKPEANGDKVNNKKTSYISAFLEKQKHQIDADNFDNDSLVHNIRTLITAGTDTLTNTLLWAITYMMLHPDVQEKAQREVDEIIGADRVPTFSDRFRTPYLDATICEIQRVRTVAPMGLPHRNREEITLFGYRIPKSTYILPNLYGVQMDPEYWTDPKEFKPERFLDENGCLKKHEQFVVYSLGKRRCLGEPLARMELYLYMATMLQHVTFKLPPNHQLDIDGQLGINLRPNNVLTCAMPRK